MDKRFQIVRKINDRKSKGWIIIRDSAPELVAAPKGGTERNHVVDPHGERCDCRWKEDESPRQETRFPSSDEDD